MCVHVCTVLQSILPSILTNRFCSLHSTILSFYYSTTPYHYSHSYPTIFLFLFYDRTGYWDASPLLGSCSYIIFYSNSFHSLLSYLVKHYCDEYNFFFGAVYVSFLSTTSSITYTLL
jgi:hypothetical protein